MKTSWRLLMVLVAVLMVIPLSQHSVSAQAKVTVHWWDIFTTPQAQVDFVTKVANDYMKAHPNVTIEMTMLENEAFREMVLSKILLGRVGQPKDVLGAVIYLASEASDLVTGHVLLVDGGWTAH